MKEMRAQSHNWMNHEQSECLIQQTSEWRMKCASSQANERMMNGTSAKSDKWTENERNVSTITQMNECWTISMYSQANERMIHKMSAQIMNEWRANHFDYILPRVIQDFTCLDTVACTAVRITFISIAFSLVLFGILLVSPSRARCMVHWFPPSSSRFCLWFNSWERCGERHRWSNQWFAACQDQKEKLMI